MLFFQRLTEHTCDDQRALLDIPFVAAAMRGDLDLQSYVAFLCEAYHHVKHTVPLLEATRDALPSAYPWLKDALGHYVEEEEGHEEWILNDIAACGFNPEEVRHGSPGGPCERMVARAWETVQCGNPLGFFGMVHTLEGTSVRGATEAAHALQRTLDLPWDAFIYLTAHGSLDVSHVDFFQGIMDKITAPEDQDTILQAAHLFFQLYGDLFRSLNTRRATPPTSRLEAAR